jgi:hypothetical protein
VEHLKRFHSGQPVDVAVFDILVGPFGGESRLVRVQMADGRRYHCHFRRPEAAPSFPGWPKERLPRWGWPGEGRVKDLSLDTVLVAVEEALQEEAFDNAFAPTRSPPESWQWIIQFYEEYPNYAWHEPVRRFLPLVRRIAASPFGTKLYASQSHETLVVSTQATGPEKESSAAVTATPGVDSIRVTQEERCTVRLREVECPLEDAWETLEPLFEWLLGTAEPGRCT